MADSKILYTPTVNSAAKELLFGGVIWRCSFITNPYSEHKSQCQKLTTFMAKGVFLYHFAIFHRTLPIKVRWIFLDLSDTAPSVNPTQKGMPCYRDWVFILRYLFNMESEDQEKSSMIRYLFTSVTHVLQYIYYTHTLFNISTGGPTNRQHAMDLLVKAVNQLLVHLPSINDSDLMLIEAEAETLRPELPSAEFLSTSDRLFGVTISGRHTYYYHTFQYCPHSTQDGCENCQIAHTEHMTNTRSFLVETTPVTL